MTDPFSTLNVPARFDVDPSAVATAAAAIGTPAAADAARQLTDPRQRAEALLAKLGAPPASDWTGLPAGFDAHRDSSGANDTARQAEIAQRWKNVASLFAQLASNDKGPVQLGRQRMIRAELNALDALSAG